MNEGIWQEQLVKADGKKQYITEPFKYTKMAKKEFSFNEVVSEIEKILQVIENGDLDVDRLAAEVKRASELIKQCQKKLRVTEEELNSIFKDLG